MIAKQELLDLATDFGLAPNVVEKDYALGWMLAGFGAHPQRRHPVGPRQPAVLEAIAENFSAVPSLKPAFSASKTAL